MNHTFLVRLNMSNPRHQKAWELLSHRGKMSYSDAVSEALISQADQDFSGQLQALLVQLQKTLENVNAARSMSAPISTPASEDCVSRTFSLSKPPNEAEAYASMNDSLDFMNGF